MIGAHAGLQRDHDVLLLHAVVRQAEEKVIVAPVAHRAAGGLLIVQQMAGQGVQQGIALLGAVKLVVQPEVLNVDGRDAPLLCVSRKSCRCCRKSSLRAMAVRAPGCTVPTVVF